MAQSGLKAAANATYDGQGTHQEHQGCLLYNGALAAAHGGGFATHIMGGDCSQRAVVQLTASMLLMGANCAGGCRCRQLCYGNLHLISDTSRAPCPCREVDA